MAHQVNSLVAILALVGGLLGFGSPAAADIVISGDQTVAHVNCPLSGEIYSELLNSGTGATATAIMGCTSTTTSLFSNSVFTSDFSQIRSGDSNDYAFGLVLVDFSVTVPTTYSISGQYTNFANTTGLEVGLSYLVSGTNLFHHLQQSSFGTTLTVGTSSGAEIDDMEGTITGLLLPGSEYRFFAQTWTQAPFNEDPGATADGSSFIEFQIASIPEPSSAAFLFGSFLVGFVGLRTARRRNVKDRHCSLLSRKNPANSPN